MKKIISLLLVLSLMATMAFALGRPAADDGTRRLDDADLPTEQKTCSEAEAAIKVTYADGRTEFYSELNKNIIWWVSYQNCDRTITLLKDIEVKSNLVPQEEWRNVPTTTIDLAGHTITATAKTYFLRSSFDSHITFKNGTIISTNTSYLFNIGGTATFVTSDRYGYACSQELVLENMKIYTEAPLLYNYQWGTKVVIKDSEIYGTGTGLVFQKSSTADHAKYGFDEWKGTYNCSIEIENSTLGCGEGAFIKADDAIQVSVKDTTFIAEQVMDAATGKLNAQGDKAEATANVTIAGKAVSGKATSYTTPAPVAPVVPSTPTPDVNVPTTGVSVMALGVMAVVSLAGAVVVKKH